MLNAQELSPNAKLKKKILLFGSQMETGGAQHNLLYQASWFHNHAYDVTVAFLYDKEGLHSRWQSLYPFPITDLRARRWGASQVENGLRLLAGLARAFGLIRRGRFDTIETFTHHANLAGIPLAWLSGVPCRIATHRGRFKSFGRWQARLHAILINSRLTSGLAANSQGSKQQAIKEGINPQKITLIPNGVELPVVNENATNRLRSDLGISHDQFLVLSVGRLRPEKGHSYLIQAAARVLRQNPAVLFVLAGDGTLRSELEEEARRLGIQAHTRFLGTRQDAPGLMAVADIFVLPSLTEGMPNALLEAMGMGTAAIATRLAGTEEIIRHAETGLLVPPADAAALADAISRLLKEDDLRCRLAAAGQAHIRQNYSLETMCRRFARLLDKDYQEDQSL